MDDIAARAVRSPLAVTSSTIHTLFAGRGKLLMSFGYFWDGFSHFLCGLVFMAVFIKLRAGREDFSPLLVLGLVVGSSSLFFLPNKLPFLVQSGNYWYQFFHYPVSDWDILLLGGRWHRFFITHSVFIPLFLSPLARNRRLSLLLLGFTVGVASHLAWDAYASANPLVVFYPHFLFLRGMFAKIWLGINSIGLLFLAEIYARLARSAKAG